MAKNKRQLIDAPRSGVQPKLYVSTIDEFQPQRANANKHDERGLGMLSQAMSEDGYVAPMTAVADGEIIDGSARLETAVEKFGDEVIVVDHDGTRPIIMRRIDIPNAETEAAKRVSLRANRIAEVDLKWDAEVLKEMDESLVAPLWTKEEWEKLLSNVELIPESEPTQPKEKKELQCPECGHIFQP